MIFFKLVCLFFITLFFSLQIFAEVASFSIDKRYDYADTTLYESISKINYEIVEGKVFFELDPTLAENRLIIDIDRASIDSVEKNKVTFSSDFHLLRPKDSSESNGILLVDILNRGKKTISAYFDIPNDNSTGIDFLINRGYTLLFLGWQFDVPKSDILLKAYVPNISSDNGIVEGIVRSDFQVQELIYSHSLGDRGHIPYSVLDIDDERNILTEREPVNGERAAVDKSLWKFGYLKDSVFVSDPNYIYKEDGFSPNRVYEVVYYSGNSSVAGLGLASIRDLVSFIKYDNNTDEIFPVSISQAISFGSSQSGRLLRTFLYDGFNLDIKQRLVFDGLMVHLGASSRGSFNHRFAQPSRATDVSYLYPGTHFPFSDIKQINPLDGTEDSLIDDSKSGSPKIFFTNSSTEYWRRPAALIHTNVNGDKDINHLKNSRIYNFSGTQHVPSSFDSINYHTINRGNPNNYRWFLRGLLIAMTDWVQKDTLPPSSVYPKLLDNTLVRLEELDFPILKNVSVPVDISRGYQLNYGTSFNHNGVITIEPPQILSSLPFLIPQVDIDGNELGGLRSPFISVPIGTFTGWYPNNPKGGLGFVLPFSRTRVERLANGDARLSLEERYDNLDHYLRLFKDYSEELIDKRFILEEDLDYLMISAEKYWR
jgi:hypothetical protein